MADSKTQEQKDAELLKAQADARKAVADADQAEADLRSSRITSLVPDLSKIDNGAVTTSDDRGSGTTLLGHFALQVAAKQVVDSIVPVLANHQGANGWKPKVLVTDKADLAALDGGYLEIMDGLHRLIRVTDDLEDELDKAFGAGNGGGGSNGQASVAAFPFIAVGIAVAQALPAVAALFGSSKSLKAFALTADTTAATAATVNQLLSRSVAVEIDDFRLVPDGHVGAMERALRDRRNKLAKRKLEVDASRAEQEQLRVTSQAAVDRLTKDLEDTTLSAQAREQLEQQLREEETQRNAYAQDVAKLVVIVGLVDDLATSIDAFLTAAHTAPAGGRSPFVVAALTQGLHRQPLDPNTVPGENAELPEPSTTHVLYLKALSGSLDQLVDDRKIGSDKIDQTASIEISYWLLETRSGNLVASGTSLGNARRHGKVDDHDLPVYTWPA